MKDAKTNQNKDLRVHGRINQQGRKEGRFLMNLGVVLKKE